MTREQVIKGLECCLRGTDWEKMCDECPYEATEEEKQHVDWDCHLDQLRKDALALLKEQEARVLTLEEVLGGDECWVEYINGGYGYCDCYLDDDAKSIVINRTLRKDFNVPPNGYGKVWRCWSARPTDEQRKAVKWE